MDQAKHYICNSCKTSVPRGHKFCGRCGEPMPEAVAAFSTEYFSDMQDPDKARLILIHGQGLDGLSYHLKADQHVVGRNGQVEFPDDPYVSPTHANFFYRNNHLVVRDEGSLNGVYVRFRGTTTISPGDTFMAGNHVFRLDPAPRAADAPDPDGTYFYSSPKHPNMFRISQVLSGGALGVTVGSPTGTLTIGREGCDLNFADDPQLDLVHLTATQNESGIQLTDHNTRNGTYLRIKSEVDLTHGDYVFLGRKLLRVELNA